LKSKKEDVVQSKLDKVFLEPTGKKINKILFLGRHILICSDTGENYHLSYYEDKFKYLFNLKGKQIKAIIWDEKPTDRGFKVLNTLI
jgi:hypothetical protein